MIEDNNFLVQLRLAEKAGLKAASQTEPLVEKSSTAESSPPSASSVDNALQDFRKLLISGDGSDVTLKVNGEELRAHRLILGARIPVFAAMFRHQMAESSTGLVSIDDCKVDIFKEFFHHVYSGSVSNMSPETVFDLHTLADKYQVDDLKAECLDFMKRTLSTDTFCNVLTVVLRHREAELLLLASDFFSKNMRKILNTVHWQVFLRENPTEANELMLKALGPDEESGNK